MERISRAKRCIFLLKAKSMTPVPRIGSSQGRGRRARRRATSGSVEIRVNAMQFSLLPLAFTALFFAAPVLSQRSSSATYDNTRQVKVQGIVTRIDWVTPNAFFFIDVRDGTAPVTNWA